MVLRVLRRLVGLAVTLALVALVTGHAGPQLAARSMSGFVTEMDAAESGDYPRVDAIAADLGQGWQQLQASATGVLHSVQDAVERLAPAR
jgi:hypothetical protein